VRSCRMVSIFVNAYVELFSETISLVRSCRMVSIFVNAYVELFPMQRCIMAQIPRPLPLQTWTTLFAKIVASSFKQHTGTSGQRIPDDISGLWLELQGHLIAQSVILITFFRNAFHAEKLGHNSDYDNNVKDGILIEVVWIRTVSFCFTVPPAT